MHNAPGGFACRQARWGLILQDIPDKIVVFIKGRKIIMSAAMDTDQGYPAGIYLLQCNTMADWNQPVFGAMNNVGMAFYFG